MAKKKKTLLLVFIHGFKGGDDTFGTFPKHLQAIVHHALPDVKVAAITYPQFETRGDLMECVSRFKEWLQNKVIDIEVKNGTPSPTIDPSVHTILIGHSMGGIVAAETLLSISRDKAIEATASEPEMKASGTDKIDDASDEYNPFMFPYIQGVLAFDTPYLGISPGVVAHGAEEKWSTASTVWSAYNNAADVLGWNSPRSASPNQGVAASRGLPAPEAAANAGGSPWAKWGKYALAAGAAAAVAGGGAAVYKNRQQLSAGWTWVGSHLEFVGCLARGQELQTRVASVTKLSEELGIGFANLYTCLGTAVQGKSEWSTGVLGPNRTFCNLPKVTEKEKLAKKGKPERWIEARNDAATDEIKAHMSMFTPKSNPGYYALTEKAKELVVGWASSVWVDDARTGADVEIDGEEEREEQVKEGLAEVEEDDDDGDETMVDDTGMSGRMMSTPDLAAQTALPREKPDEL